MIPIEDQEQLEIPATLPLLPVRDLVVFPYMIVPLFVSREVSVSAIEQALASHRMVLLVAQREAQQDQPGVEDLYRMGTVGMVMRMRRLADGRLKVLVQGIVRGRIDSLQQDRTHFSTSVKPIYDLPLEEISVETEALMRTLREKLQHYSEVSGNLEEGVLGVLQGLKDPGRLADLVASNLTQAVDEAQRVLETPDPIKRLRLVTDHLARELELVSAKARIEIRTREKLGKTQRDYFLREQMRQIRSELGEEALEDDFRELEGLIENSDMPEPVAREAKKQLARLSRMHPESAEAGTIRTYLEWLLDLTWQGETEDQLDLQKAKEVLDEDHLGLEEAKDRVLEFLGVRKLNPENPGPILLLVGPPGGGKTSLGRSIARAMQRKFVRVSLGGSRDEAEIRGHRRTYVGAMPGRIIQGMKQAGSVNPVFMLDEVDKLGRDFRGDPSAALLEVLDPEQNSSFEDHYLNVPFDLSRVMFIATANRTDTIPAPLLDRMEEIRLPGYTLEEKRDIAIRHLAPRQLIRNGLSELQLQIGPESLTRMIEEHTREAGLRQLERAIAQVCRKIARRVAEGETLTCQLSPDELRSFLGPPIHLPLEQLPDDVRGIANGLAWTPTGGELIQVEALAMAGRGQLILTGQLGDIMKESAQAAQSFARSRANRMGLAADFFSSHDIHIHVPAGSIPKDGPSAGVTIAVALISLLTELPVRRQVAMTGEISLSGRLLPVGGLREKLLAARRAGLTEVIVPAQNHGDLELVPTEVREKITIHESNTIEDVLNLALARKPWGDSTSDPSETGRKRKKDDKTRTASPAPPVP
jgi:ATP-dependent Lon protease